MPKLADVAEINPRFDRSESNDLSELISFVPMANVSDVLGAITSEEHRQLGGVIKGFTTFKDRDVLVAKITPCFENGKIAHARINKRLGFGSTEFHVVRPETEKLDDRYLYHFLRQPVVREDGKLRMTGSGGQKRVPKTFIEELEIPLPSLPEQRRIAAILDKADALRAKRREAISKLDQLLHSVFMEMFGDPVTNPKRWPTVTVAEIAEVQGGLQFSASRKAIPNSVPYLRVANVQRGFLDLAEIKEMGATIAEVQRIRLKAGDILVVEGHGNPDEIGRCAIWDGSISECIHQNHLIRVRANPEIVTPSFLESYLNSDVGSRWLKGSARTTSGLNTISVKKVRETQVLLPPLALQQRWDAFVLSVAARRSVALLAAFKNTSLFEALQAQAFSGNL